MNVLEQNGASEDVEATLRTFFRAEVPQPWPALTPPPVAKSSRRQLVRRVALAASIALLLAGQWWLSSTSNDTETVAPRGTPALREATNRPPHKLKTSKQPVKDLRPEVKK